MVEFIKSFVETRRRYVIASGRATRAQSQIDAAKGTNIVWRIASPEKAANVQDILDEKRIFGITIEFLGQ